MRVRSVGLLVPLLAATAACDDSTRPTADHLSPIGATRQISAALAGPGGRLPDDAEPTDSLPELIIDLPDTPPEFEKNDAALVDAVRRSGGRAFVGLKPPESSPTRETGRIPAISRASVLGARAAIEQQGARVVRGFSTIPVVVVEIAPELAPTLRKLPFVNYVEPATIAKVAHEFPPQDTSWGVKKVRAQRLYPFNNGGAAWVTILDSGTDFSHLFEAGGDGPSGLSGSTCLYTASSGISDCYDAYYHGTHVAGILAAHTGTWGMIGVAYGLSGITAIRVCDAVGDCPIENVAGGLEWVATSGKSRHIVNMSLGTYSNSTTLANSVAAAYNAGALLVASAGNNPNAAGTTNVAWPAKYSQVIAVSGTLEDDSFASSILCPRDKLPPTTGGSNFGPEVELSAPFVARSSWLHLEYGTDCGTSMAAPVVSGVAALVWTRNPGWTRDQVRQRLQQRAIDLGPAGHDNQFGYGRVDAVRAVYTVTVTMSGPTFITTGLKTWTANPSGGETPYGFVWERREFCSSFWYQVGTGSSYSEQLTYGQPTFYLRVTATSTPLQESASATKQVGGFMMC